VRPFAYTRVTDIAGALHEAAAGDARYLAGGTNLVDLMKDDVDRPAKLVDVNRLPLREITESDDGGLRIGALVTNARTAYDPRVATRYPLLASAILAGASAQIRNAATNGGNLNQRTRCLYFYDTGSACNKRQPGSGCGAIGGVTRAHAILGTSEDCIATHPSDMCVALAALDAMVRVTGRRGDRTIPIADYHRLPGAEPSRDNTLEPGELVTAIDLPAGGFGAHHTYLKIRDRLSYAFALVSVAVVMRLEGGVITEARIALGGVAHKPWRVTAAERHLDGAAPSSDVFASAADILLEGAAGRGGNDFKIPLARRAVIRACGQAAAGTPQA
jgi:xanthine dehydrogenase YagS FAD-binding subunit